LQQRATLGGPVFLQFQDNLLECEHLGSTLGSGSAEEKIVAHDPAGPTQRERF
jgi:hypothetical protein